MRPDEYRRVLDVGVQSEFADLRPCDDLVVAVDAEGDYGAVFVLSAWGERSFDARISLAQRPGRWEEVMSGGTSGAWPDPYPWVPPSGGWDDGLLLSVGTTCTSVFPDGHEATLTGIAGFAAGAVSCIRVEHDELRRSVAVRGRLGPFVVAAVGHGDVTLTPTDEHDLPLALAQVFTTSRDDSRPDGGGRRLVLRKRGFRSNRKVRFGKLRK